MERADTAAAKPPQRMTSTRVEVLKCPRCGDAHDVVAMKLTHAAITTVALSHYGPMQVATWTHWAMCPKYNEPFFHGVQPEWSDARVEVSPETEEAR
jgi:hypothetical protein